MTNSKGRIADLGIALISGYIGTKVMEPVSMKLYEMESDADRQREDAVRPGPPYDIAAEKTAGLLGVQLSDTQKQTAGLVFHYGLGMGWAPVYTFLRRHTSLNPLLAGLVAGAAMSLIVDEGLTPMLGFSAPNKAYPLATHLRGVVAHLTFGVGVAAAAETLRWLGENAQTAQADANASTG